MAEFPNKEESKKLNFWTDAYYMMRDKTLDNGTKLTFETIESKAEELFNLLDVSGLVDNVAMWGPSFGQGKLNVDEYVAISGHPLSDVIEKIRIVNEETQMDKIHPYTFRNSQEIIEYKSILIPTIKESCKKSLECILRN